jgi:hypothetical protein
VQQYDLICYELLTITNMVRNRRLSAYSEKRVASIRSHC